MKTQTKFDGMFDRRSKPRWPKWGQNLVLLAAVVYSIVAVAAMLTKVSALG